jgi:hypothetical protein
MLVIGLNSFPEWDANKTFADRHPTKGDNYGNDFG